MPLYYYKAKSGPDKVVEGEIESPDYASAIKQMQAGGLTPIAVEEAARGKRRSLRGAGKVRKADISVFTSQLADLLAAGVKLHEAIDALQTQTASVALKRVLSDVSSRLQEGSSFSSALNANQRVFGAFYVQMVLSGEKSGQLDLVLETLSGMIEEDDRLASSMKQSFVYPAFIGICGLGTVAAVMLFVIPKISKMYTDMGRALPALTQFTVFVSMSVKDYWWGWAAAVLLLFFFIRTILNKDSGRALVFDLALKYIPVWGRVLLCEEYRRLAGALAVMLESGVSVIDAFEVGADVLRSDRLKESASSVPEMLSKGTGLGSACRSNRLFDGIYANMIETAEKSATLPAVFIRISESYRKKQTALMKSVTTLIEPVMVLIIGGIVGLVVISMLLPIFRINLLIG